MGLLNGGLPTVMMLLLEALRATQAPPAATTCLSISSPSAGGGATCWDEVRSEAEKR